MAQRDYSSHQRKIINRYYEHLDTITVNKLSELVSDLYLCEDDRKAAKLWQSVKKALGRTAVESEEVAAILENKDVAQLAQVVNELANMKPGAATAKPSQPEGHAAAPAPAPSPAPRPPMEITPQVLKSAYNAFKKRLKLARLDESSKIGRSPLSGGSGPAIVAIQPPREYPKAVWDELVRQGRLKTDGRGFYSMP